MNIQFIHLNGFKVFVQIKKEQTINELINLYLQKIEMPNLMNNYKEKCYFIFNGKDLYNLNTKKVGEIFYDFAKINVYEKSN